jgi:hypothetical protein
MRGLQYMQLKEDQVASDSVTEPSRPFTPNKLRDGGRKGSYAYGS